MNFAMTLIHHQPQHPNIMFFTDFMEEALMNGTFNSTSTTTDTTSPETSMSEEGTPEGQAPSVRKKGKCKWFNVVKKYGFIKPNDGGQDVFVHQSVIQRSGFRSLADEEEVEYECRCSDKGVEATLVCGPNGSDCKGRPPRQRKFKCYNCGEYSNHLALKCPKGPLPKSCYECLGCDHLIKDCPKRDTKSTGNDESSNDESSTKHIKTSGKSVQGT